MDRNEWGEPVASTPPIVPVAFWWVDSMQQAIARRHMGEVIYAYRHHPWHETKVFQWQMAMWLHMSQPGLSRLESGKARQSLDRLIFYARTLGIPHHLLWFTMPVAPNPSTAPKTAGVVHPGGGS